MDGDTTSINELPIITSLPPNDANEEMEKINLTTERNMIDRETINIAQENTEKRVRFEDEMQKNEIKEDLQPEQKYDLSIQFKIIILATLLFFFFMDPKIKKYLLNILVQVFGSFLKNEHNNMSQIGMLFYTLFYGLIMTIIVKTVDISSFHLAL
jgi:hypothetical protein